MFEEPIFCKMNSHEENQIYGICLDSNCKNQRVCCRQCTIEYHKNHLNAIKPLAEIKSKYQHIQHKLTAMLREISKNITKQIEDIHKLILESGLFPIFPKEVNITTISVFADKIMSGQDLNQVELALKFCQNSVNKILQQCSQNLQIFNPQLIKNKQQSESYLNQGDQLFGQYKYEEALMAYHQAISFNEFNDEAWNGMAAVYVKLGNFNQALASFDKGLEINQANFKLHRNKGAVLNKLGQYDSALNCFDKALSLKESSGLTWKYKAHTYQSKQRYEEALECYKRAIQYDPSPDNFQQTGKLLEKMGREDEASEYFAKALLCG